MPFSINRAQLAGNLGRDPEIRTMQSGSKVANLSLATNESWKDKQTGERKQSVEWHRVVIFGDGLINVVEQYCHKGDSIYIEGQIRTRKWTDQAGNDRYSTEIVMSGPQAVLKLNGSPTNGGSERSEPDTGSEPEQYSSDGEPDDFDDDEIPF